VNLGKDKAHPHNVICNKDLIELMNRVNLGATSARFVRGALSIVSG
jgi:hypothetical protein